MVSIELLSASHSANSTALVIEASCLSCRVACREVDARDRHSRYEDGTNATAEI